MRVLFLLLFLAPGAASAGDCGWNADHTIFDCHGFYSGAVSGASAPTLTDAIEQAAAALPTIPTPIGVEGGYVSRSAPGGNPKFTASVLKGYRGIAFGAGTWADGSFAAPDLSNHFVGTNLDALYHLTAPTAAGARVATAIAVPHPLVPKGVSLSVGGSLGFGRGAGSSNPEGSVQLNVLGVAVSYSVGYQVVAPLLPRVNVATLSAGTQLLGLHLGYANQVLRSNLRRTEANLLSCGWTGGAFALWLGEKWEKNQFGASTTWGRAGAQWRGAAHFGLTYEYGTYQNSQGLSAQLYF